MPTATFNKFNNLVDELGNGEHDWGADTLKLALTNTAPTAADANWNLTDHPAPVAANGYPAGGNTLTGVTYTETGGVGTLDATGGLVFTASGGDIGPFRYLVLYNSSSATPTNAAISFYDYGSSITLSDTETLTVTLPTDILQIT